VLDEVLTIDQAHALSHESLLKVGLAGKLLHFLRGSAAVADENFSGFTASGEIVGLCRRDQLFDKSLQLLGSAKGRVHVTMANHLSRQVREERPALVARESKFASIYKVSH